MPKEEWGTKRLCPHCGTRFYDLQNDPMTCPACEAQFTLDSLTSGRGRTIAAEKTSSKVVEPSDDLVDDELEEDDSAELDDDLLDDDDDDADVSLDEIADRTTEDED
ncbi:FYDLN acid domain-containing protein [Paracoccus jeotgali]|uniref:TIGR02300 family protein n=1 Tax=Paracoccus jeotgali TaxID=2065379 RepID=A0A2K9MF00_9RHOB|nr:FYDLN acid domain-containing protein [Paracoccus jeotgali]AUM74174.1 TIGR02300 family protein [Paracoccus jeotgali]